MTKLKVFFVLLLAFCCSSLNSVGVSLGAHFRPPSILQQKPQTPPPLKLIAYSMADIFEPNVPSVHYEFWKLLSEKLETKVNYQFYPINRANRVFSESKNACLYIASLRRDYFKNTLKMDPNSVLFSDVLTTMNLRVYSRAGLAPVTSLDQISGKMVSMRKPFSENEKKVAILLSATRLTQVENQDHIMSMLDQGRVDYGIVYDTNAKLIYKQSGMQPLPVSTEFDLYKIHQGMACTNSPRNKRVIEIFNKTVKELKESGEMPLLFNSD